MDPNAPFTIFQRIEQNTMLGRAAGDYFGDISASKIAQAIGAHPHEPPIGLVRARKNLRATPIVDKEYSLYAQRLMANGRRMEPLILEAVKPFFHDVCSVGTSGKRETAKGRYIITATPDAVCREGLIEIKASAPVTDDDEEVRGIKPTLRFYDMPQVLAQMWCFDVKHCFYCRHNGL
jgi:hypothetical protein